MNFYDKAYELMKALKESEEYKNYMKIKEKLKQTTEIYEKLKEFKTAQREEQLKYISGKETTEETRNILQERYSILIQNTDVVEFFGAEIKLDIMLTDMQKIINETMKDIVEL